MGKLKFFASCVNMKEEAGDYTWKIAKDGTQEDVPVDRKNHLMDALRYLCMGLPFDFKECYNISKPTLNSNKDTLINRLRPDTDISEFIGKSEGGAYGLGSFNID